MEEKNEENSGLLRHAKRELELAGAMEDWPLYRDIIKVFASQGHSGGSASVVIPNLNKLLQFQNLSPLTSKPEEWTEVGEGVWQSKRNPSIFSKDGGATWYALN